VEEVGGKKSGEQSNTVTSSIPISSRLSPKQAQGPSPMSVGDNVTVRNTHGTPDDAVIDNTSNIKIAVSTKNS